MIGCGELHRICDLKLEKRIFIASLFQITGNLRPVFSKMEKRDNESGWQSIGARQISHSQHFFLGRKIALNIFFKRRIIIPVSVFENYCLIKPTVPPTQLKSLL